MAFSSITEATSSGRRIHMEHISLPGFVYPQYNVRTFGGVEIMPAYVKHMRQVHVDWFRT